MRLVFSFCLNLFISPTLSIAVSNRPVFHAIRIWFLFHSHNIKRYALVYMYVPSRCEWILTPTHFLLFALQATFIRKRNTTIPIISTKWQWHLVGNIHIYSVILFALPFHTVNICQCKFRVSTFHSRFYESNTKDDFYEWNLLCGWAIVVWPELVLSKIIRLTSSLIHK